VHHHARHRVTQERAARGPDPGRGGNRRRHGGRAGAAIVLALVVSGAFPSAPRAAEGLFLTWNDCDLGASATSNRAFACDANTGLNELYVAFTMPQAADNVVAVEIVVDLQHSAPVLPDWWHVEPNGCRWALNESNIAAAATFPGSACVNMWQGAATPAIAEVAGYTPSQTASQVRIKVTASVLPADARTVNDTDMYYAARITLTNNRTVGSPSCAGCSGAACLVLNSILIGRLDGSPNFFLQTPGPSEANWARWQGGTGADCAAVPVRNRAWGQLKGLYR
jgi:hypothetical protein